MTPEYLLTSLIVILLPGTGVIYTVAVGLARGFRPSVAAALGCTFGIVPAAVASILGLAAVFHTSTIAFLIIKYLGVIYLFYMAWSIIRDKGIKQIEEDTTGKSYLRTAIDGTLLNVLNPKLSLFFLAFLPQFVPKAHTGSIVFLAYLASLFMLLTFIVFVLYGAFASTARKYIIDSPAIILWLKRVFAGAFGFLGLRLTFAEQ
ncbi:lysine transporter LysE [Chromatiales bacterium (ex Bugula neritina AB1)]|nr:lysine transporter LysE [Chromatiales bacterium (ex Bugula neritina AB1)]